MFLEGEESLATLANLVRAFRGRRTSYLGAAMITDVELFEASLDQPEPPDPGPSFVEETTEVSLLKVIVEQLQQLSHLTARQPGPAKVKKLPRPRTAEDMYVAWLASLPENNVENDLIFVEQQEK